MGETLGDEGLYGKARFWAMSAILLTVMLSVLDYAIANVALPQIAIDMHTTNSASIWVVNAYQLACMVTILPFSSLGAKIGFARMYYIGLALFTIASLLCAVSTSILELAIFRALQGMGSASGMSVGVALIRFIFPAKEMGKGMAINGMVVALGAAMGPSIAGGILAFASWPWLFLINVPLGILAFVVSWFSLPETPRVDRPFDVMSAFLSVVGIGALIIGGDGFAHDGNVILAGSLIVAGMIFVGLLTQRQVGNPQPLLPVDLLMIRDFRVAFIVSITGFICATSYIVSIPFFLQEHYHYTAAHTGLIMTSWSLAILCMGPIVGRLADRVSAGILTSIGLFITGIGFVFLCFLPHPPTDFDFIWRIGLAGIGFGFFQPPNNKEMMVSAPASRSGGAAGMVAIGRLTGQTLGAMLVAMVFELITYEPNRVCLAIAAGTAFLSALLSVSRVFLKREKNYPG
ncbi:MFS transporter [Entomobacter blattae]|uniref:Riboflavin transporter RibZ n=1 Tax=Entomobacter blattae TaxID=2762277 RepID=A0A7H1NPL3_9PROT|nr:MFS transporter [Entomobacter blattae]QNT77723.1 Riboflavin transporter RibZ [Entomobacter blattae]